MQNLCTQMTALKGFLVSIWKKEEGVAAVELALTFPLYLSMIFLVIEFARIAFTQIVVLHAAEETTRYALVNFNATTLDLQTFAKDALVLIDPDNLSTVVITAPTDDTDQTRMFTVQIQYLYAPVVPIHHFLPGASAEGFNISGASRGFITQEIPSGA